MTAGLSATPTTSPIGVDGVADRRRCGSTASPTGAGAGRRLRRRGCWDGGAGDGRAGLASLAAHAFAGLGGAAGWLGGGRQRLELRDVVGHPVRPDCAAIAVVGDEL